MRHRYDCPAPKNNRSVLWKVATKVFMRAAQSSLQAMSFLLTRAFSLRDRRTRGCADEPWRDI